MKTNVHTQEDRFSTTTTITGNADVRSAMEHCSYQTDHGDCQEEFVLQQRLLITRLSEHDLLLEPEFEALVIKVLKRVPEFRYELTYRIPHISESEGPYRATIFGGTPTKDHTGRCCPAACGIMALNTTRERVVPTLADFFCLTRKHDWFWFMADDYNVYKRGSREENALVGLATRMGAPYQRVYNTVVASVRTTPQKKLEDIQLPFKEVGLDGGLLHSLRQFILLTRTDPNKAAEALREVQGRFHREQRS